MSRNIREFRPKLSLVAQFDDIVRCNAQLTAGIEDEFLTFVRCQNECRHKWKAVICELDCLKLELFQMKEKNNLAETKLKHMKSLIEKEIQKRLKVENEKKSLERQITIIKEVLLADQNALDDQAKEKLAFLSTHTYMPNRPNGGNERSPYRLDTIEESMGSVLSASDVSFDKTDEDLDGDPANIYSVINRSRSKRSSSRVDKDSSASKKVKLQGYSEDDPTENIKNKADSENLKIENPDVINKNYNNLMDGLSVIPDEPVNIVYTRSRTSLGSTPVVHRRLSSTGRLNRGHTFCTKTVIRPETCLPCGKRIKFYKQAFKCQDCRSTCHPECKDNVPLPCIPTMQTPTGKGTQNTISDYTPSTSPMIPALIVHCVKEIERRGLCEIGLYRVSGSEREVKELKEKFIKGKSVPCMSKMDIHAVCSAIKEFLRSLREPLVSRALWQNFVNAAELTDKEEGLKGLYSAIELLPQANRDTLAFLMLHLHKIANNPRCKMPAENLSKVFGPTIVGYSSPDADNGDKILSDTKSQYCVMQLLFQISTEYWESFVGMDNDIFVTPEPRPAPEGNMLGPLSGNGYNSAYRSRGGVVVGKTPLTPRVNTGSLKSRRQFFTSPMLK